MEPEIRQTTAAFANALSRGDAVDAAALYLEDARLLAPTAELIAGRCEIEAYWRAGIALGVSRMELETLDLAFAGAVAIEIGRYAVSVDADRGELVVDCGKYLMLHRQQADGSWRRAVDVFNPDAPETTRRASREGAAPARVRAGLMHVNRKEEQ